MPIQPAPPPVKWRRRFEPMKQTETESSILPPPSAAPHGAELGAPPTQSAPLSPTIPLFLLGGIGLVLAILAVITVLSRSRARAELESDTLANLVPTVNIIHPDRKSTRSELQSLRHLVCRL